MHTLKRFSFSFAFLFGGLLVLAFPPMNIWLFAILSPAVLFLIWQQQKTLISRLAGAFAFAISFYGFGLWWVYIAIHVFGDASIVLSVVIVTCFIVFLSLYFLGFATLWHLLNKHLKLAIWQQAGVFAILWCLLSYARSTWFSGFPWLLLGQSFVHSPFAGFIPILGNYGMILLFVSISSTWLISLFNKNIKYSSLLSILILCLGVLGHYLQDYSWTQPIPNKTVSVALIQANIPQSIKWQPQAAKNSFLLYEALTRKQTQAKLIVWPEAAIVYPLAIIKPALMPLKKLLISRQQSLITGIPVQNKQSKRYQNAAITIGYLSHGKYIKRHLVPFGENIPPFLNWLRPIITMLNIPMSNLQAGKMQQALIHVQHIPVGIFICYEVAYPDVIKQDLPKAELFMTISDDAWFGHSFASYQHLGIAAFRALQSGRPMLMASNNGITAIINAHGKLSKSIPRFKRAVLNGQITPYQGSTPWTHWGNHYLIIILMLLLLVVILPAKWIELLRSA